MRVCVCACVNQASRLADVEDQIEEQYRDEIGSSQDDQTGRHKIRNIHMLRVETNYVDDIDTFQVKESDVEGAQVCQHRFITYHHLINVT